MVEGTFGMLLLLVAGHFVCDYPLQGDYLSRAKGDFASPMRRYHLFAHAGIHAGMVTLITGLPWLGVLEWVLHYAIDESKVYGKINYVVDQLLHLLCKYIIWMLWVAWIIDSIGSLD